MRPVREFYPPYPRRQYGRQAWEETYEGRRQVEEFHHPRGRSSYAETAKSCTRHKQELKISTITITSPKAQQHPLLFSPTAPSSPIYHSSPHFLQTPIISPRYIPAKMNMAAALPTDTPESDKSQHVVVLSDLVKDTRGGYIGQNMNTLFELMGQEKSMDQANNSIMFDCLVEGKRNPTANTSVIITKAIQNVDLAGDEQSHVVDSEKEKNPNMVSENNLQDSDEGINYCPTLEAITPEKGYSGDLETTASTPEKDKTGNSDNNVTPYTTNGEITKPASENAEKLNSDSDTFYSDIEETTSNEKVASESENNVVSDKREQQNTQDSEKNQGCYSKEQNSTCHTEEENCPCIVCLQYGKTMRGLYSRVELARPGQCNQNLTCKNAAKIVGLTLPTAAELVADHSCDILKRKISTNHVVNSSVLDNVLILIPRGFGINLFAAGGCGQRVLEIIDLSPPKGEQNVTTKPKDS